jgi:hypothetical protein
VNFKEKTNLANHIYFTVITKKMKRFNQNRTQTNEVGNSNVRPSFFGKLAHKHRNKLGAAIFAIIALHFVSQFVFFPSDNPQIEENLPKIENEQTVEIKTENEVAKPNIVAKPEVVPSVVQPERKIAPSQTLIKKKEPRESRAERLRRAEKILTGI